MPPLPPGYESVLGRELGKARVERGLSVDALAERFDVHPRTVRRWEGSETIPDQELHLRAIAEFLGISYEEAVGLSHLRERRDDSAPLAASLEQVHEQLEHVSRTLEQLTAKIEAARVKNLAEEETCR